MLWSETNGLVSNPGVFVSFKYIDDQSKPSLVREKIWGNSEKSGNICIYTFL